MANCIGPYKLIAELGSGAMGKVNRARAMGRSGEAQARRRHADQMGADNG